MGWDWSNYRLCFAFLAILAAGVEARAYYGVRIGTLSRLHHAVQGEVFAVDSRTIHLRGFSYDGTAPDAFFYAGTSSQPSDSGFIIPDENGGVKPLGRYRNKDITITLPDGKTFKDIRWISVWCRAFAIDFGNVRITSNMDYPRPQKIGALPTLEHGVSSDRIVVVDAQTFLIPNFSYDGSAPDGHFWVGKGTTPGPKGQLVPDENGSEEPLKRYSGKTIVITLPGDLTVFDIDFLSIWCRAFLANFGNVRIPKNLNVPPSLKMLGVAPQSQRPGYSYQPPSSSRPAFSYEPQTNKHKPTTSRPSYTPPTRPPTTRRPPYRAWPPANSPASHFTTGRPTYPRPTTARPTYPRPTTTRRPPYQPPTTRRPHYKTTTRRPLYKSPATTRRPYSPFTTTPRPPYRRPHFDSDESREVSVSSSGFGGHRNRHAKPVGPPRNGFPPKPTTSGSSHFSQHRHFGGSASRHRDDDDDDDDDDSDEGHFKGSSRRAFSPSPHRFGSPATTSRSPSDSKNNFSSFHFSNGGSSSSFNIYG